MSTGNRILDIEVLRAIAVMVVVLHHLNGTLYRFPQDSTVAYLYTYVNGGVGVDLFFAISGFVIARSLLPRFSQRLNPQQFKSIAFSFWVRRAARLLPSAWLWLAIILLLQIFFNESGTFGTLKANIEATVAAVLQIANVRFADGFMRYELGASFVYWSLSLEEQFYLVFPFLALLARKKLVTLLLIIICIQLMQARGIWLMMFRTDAICFGVLVAMMHSTVFYKAFSGIFQKHVVVAAILMTILLILLILSGGEQQSLGRYFKSAASILSFCIVLLASLNTDITARIFPFRQALVWVGARSYAIYLIHVPVFKIIQELCFRLEISISEHVPLLIVISFILMGIFAELNFRYIEDPIRRWGSNLADRKFRLPAQTVPTAT